MICNEVSFADIFAAGQKTIWLKLYSKRTRLARILIIDLIVLIDLIALHNITLKVSLFNMFLYPSGMCR